MQIRKTYLYLQRLTRYIMQNIEQKTPLANNHISVDCVVTVSYTHLTLTSSLVGSEMCIRDR